MKRPNRKTSKYMNVKYLINIALVCALLLCACGKEDIIDFPITLHAHELSRVSDVRLFVNKNEIYDSNVIEAFVSNSEYFKLPTPAEIQSSNESISFLSKDSVLFGTLTIGFTVKKNANQFLFYSSLMFPTNSGDILHSLLKYPSELVPLSHFTGFKHLTREVLVGYGSYKKLELSFFSYMLSINGDSFQQFISGKLSNEFNEEAINTLQLRDTLAIQEYRVRFIAK